MRIDKRAAFLVKEPKEMKEDDFFVSLVADARGGVCYSKRLPGFKLIVPQNCLQEPTRIFAKAIRESKNTLRLMDGEVQASKILEFTEMKFNGNIAVDIPCLVPESRDHDILVLMSYDCVTWKQISHERSHFEDEKTNSRRVLLNFLPKYISLYTRYRMTSLNVGPGGGSLPTHDETAKVQFPPGALKKMTNVMIQTFPVPKFFCPSGVAAGPVLSLEPRRRRFHQNVNYYLKGPDGVDELLGSHHCRVLCSITEGANKTDWKDVSENLELKWNKDAATFVGNLSGRFWILFFSKENYQDNQQMLNVANQIYRLTITPSYAVDVRSKIKRTNDILQLEISIKCASQTNEKHIRIYENHFINVAVTSVLSSQEEEFFLDEIIHLNLNKFRPFTDNIMTVTVDFNEILDIKPVCLKANLTQHETSVLFIPLKL